MHVAYPYRKTKLINNSIDANGHRRKKDNECLLEITYDHRINVFELENGHHSELKMSADFRRKGFAMAYAEKLQRPCR